MSEESSATDTKTEITGHVALIDILGFRSIVARRQFAQEFPDYTKAVDGAVADQGAVEYLVFSDNIIIYDRKSSNNIGPIAACCSNLFDNLLKIGLPFRGAIAHGRFSYQTPDKGTIIAGRPIIEAHQYEQMQDWIGVMLCPSVVEAQWPRTQKSSPLASHIPDCIRAYHKIPLKSEREGSVEGFHGYAIIPDLTAQGEEKPGCFSRIHRLSEIAPNPAAQRKYHNTVAFLEYVQHEISHERERAH